MFPSSWLHNSLLLVLSLFSLTASASSVTSRHQHEKSPVCIIGAGPAGLSAAARLEQKNIKAVIFDNQKEVGGKCQAWYDSRGIFHPLGAAFFSNATYPETLKVLEQTNVSIAPFALAGAREMFRYNFTSGAIEANPAPSPQFFAAVGAEIPRYIALWNQRFAPISTTNYKNGVPNEFTVSGSQWFRNNNFTALPILLVNPVALYGYGDINIVPALYILQYFTPDILTGFVGLHGVYYTDFHKIFVEYAKKALSGTQIHTSSEVRCVDRSGENPVLTYTQPEGNYIKWNKQQCSSVIFAFPPNIASLERAGIDLTEEEYNTFSNVSTNQYYSSAVELKLPYGVSYIANSSSPALPPSNDGEPVAVLRLSQQSNVSTAWSWGPYEVQAASTGERLLIESLSEINKDPRNASEVSTPLKPGDVKAFMKWDYFPHFGPDALRSGAYKSYNDLQGCKNSYWVSGGLAGMEIVEWAIRGGHDVVDTYFSGGSTNPNTTSTIGVPRSPSPPPYPTTAISKSSTSGFGTGYPIKPTETPTSSGGYSIPKPSSSAAPSRTTTAPSSNVVVPSGTSASSTSPPVFTGAASSLKVGSIAAAGAVAALLL